MIEKVLRIFDTQEILITGTNVTSKKTKKSEDHQGAVDGEECYDFDNGHIMSVLSRILESTAELRETICIVFDERGLTFQCVDAGEIALCEGFISSTSFKRYRCDESMQLGLQLKPLLKILRALRFTGDYTFEFSCDKESEKLVLTFKSDEFSCVYNLMLISIDNETSNSISCEYDTEINISRCKFATMQRIISGEGSYITISVCNKQLEIKTSYNKNDVCFKLDGEKGSHLCSISTDVKLSKEIPRKIFNCAAKTAEISEKVQICLGDATPVYFYFDLKEVGYYKLYVATRIDPSG